MERPTLGQHVTASDRMYRTWTDGEKIYRRWASFIPGGPKPVEGTYIGYRTVQDGRNLWEEDCGYIWYPSEYKEAWLIVENPRQNPIKVFPEDVTL